MIKMKVAFFLITVGFFISFVPVAESQTNGADVQAMQSLSKNINGATALKWTDPDPCNWPQVACETPGRITRIQIGNCGLAGTLPAELRNLTSLRRLELQNNGLSGPLPSLGGLSQLEILLLHNNSFSSIPSDFFSGLSSLQAVDVDKNPFSPWQIPESLKDAQTLVNFSANTANVTGPIPDFLGSSFPSFNHLGLAYNFLQGGLPTTFAESPMVSLWVNNQNGVKLSGGVDVIKSMTSLQQAWLQSNAFTGPLPEFPQSNPLRELNVRDNQITGIVPQSLISLPSLRKIVFANNPLQGEMPSFPKSVDSDLNETGTINRFCLSSPGKCDSRVDALLSIAKNLNYPVKLANDWDGNDPCNNWMGITCNGGDIIVINFQKMGFGGTISPDFVLFKSLQKLLLADNNLTGSIPPEIAKLPNLLELDVRNNKISGKVPSFNGNVKVETDGNPDIGKDTGGSSGSPGTSPAGGGSSSGRGNGNDEGGNKKSSNTTVIVGSIVGGGIGLCFVAGLAYCLYRRKQHKFALTYLLLFSCLSLSLSLSHFHSFLPFWLSPFREEMALKSPLHADIGGISFLDSRKGSLLKLKGGIHLKRKESGMPHIRLTRCSAQVPPPAWPGRAIVEPGRKVWDGPKPISIVGSTGSIGTQTLDIVAENPNKFRVVALAAGSNVTLLADQVKTFKPQLVAVRNESLVGELKEALADAEYKPEIIPGEQGVIEVARHPDAVTVVTGIVGCAGLKPTVAAIEAGKDIALANKETLIAGGPFVLPLAQKHKVKILPADSEHSAIFQCIQGLPEGALRRIILTASGGAFRDLPVEKLKEVKVADALKHPNWDMGKKITVDSATLFNKGLEVIEAHYLFGAEYDDIEIVIHPQSIIHSMVETQDSSVLAQLGWPDMRLPILYTMSWPERIYCSEITWPRLDLCKLGSLTFKAPDNVKYPSMDLAYSAGRAGGTMTGVLSAANEKAVEMFINEKIGYLDIFKIVELTCAEHRKELVTSPSLEEIIHYDLWAREFAANSLLSSGRRPVLA